MLGIDMQLFVAIALFALAAKLSSWHLAARAAIAVVIPYLYSLVMSYIFALQTSPSPWQLLTWQDILITFAQFLVAIFVFYKLNQTEDSSLVAWITAWTLGAVGIYLLLPTIVHVFI